MARSPLETEDTNNNKDGYKYDSVIMYNELMTVDTYDHHNSLEVVKYTESLTLDYYNRICI